MLYFEWPANKIAKNQVCEKVFGWMLLFFRRCSIACVMIHPWKLTRKLPIEKDNHHPVTSILGFNMSILQGLVTFFKSDLGAVLVVPAAPLDMDHSQKASAMLGSQSKSILIDLQLTHQGLGIIRNDTVLIYENESSYNKIMMNFFFNKNMTQDIFRSKHI